MREVVEAASKGQTVKMISQRTGSGKRARNTAVSRFTAEEPKNLVGGPLLDLGPGRLVEHREQRTGLRSGLQGHPPQRRDAPTAPRPRQDPQQPPGHAQADPLGLGDGGELVLLVGGDLDGMSQPLLEGLNLGLPPG